uniref:Uncharacterized protein n=1 Tax=Timema bartmani TaxID=61472 RepID=A0A7R9EXZ5_9NEOP|nr:unnamed protein product [Timema bartmani]
MWKLLDAVASEVPDKARNDYLTALNEARDRRPRLDRQELQNRTDYSGNDDDDTVSNTETDTSGTHKYGTGLPCLYRRSISISLELNATNTRHMPTARPRFGSGASRRARAFRWKAIKR